MFALALILHSWLSLLMPAADPATSTSTEDNVPGIIIYHHPASVAKKQYVGSPGIIALSKTHYLAKLDLFGPNAAKENNYPTYVFESLDAGQTWQQIASLDHLFWANIFEHNGALYLLGTTGEHQDLVIRRSTDIGRTWTEPLDAKTGLIAQGKYHTAPMPIIEHNGRLWRAFEEASRSAKWGDRYSAMMISAPIGSDLLDRDSWLLSDMIVKNPKWLDGKFNAFLEGNAVITPEGDLVDILRVDDNLGRTAAVVHIDDDGKKVTFDPEKDFIEFPGGAKKFTIRFDPQTKSYWTLTNWVPDFVPNEKPASKRNTLALAVSKDLKTWEIRSVILHHPDHKTVGFQYVDWLFEDDDLIVASRTAFKDDSGNAHNQHDANYLTFHRIQNFRDLTMKDSCADYLKAAAKP
ncbi:sialidase family protein [Lacunimicrobium album]